MLFLAFKGNQPVKECLLVPQTDRQTGRQTDRQTDRQKWNKIYSLVWLNLPPAEHFATVEPLDPRSDVSELHKLGQSPDFEASAWSVGIFLNLQAAYDLFSRSTWESVWTRLIVARMTGCQILLLLNPTEPFTIQDRRALCGPEIPIGGYCGSKIEKGLVGILKSSFWLENKKSGYSINVLPYYIEIDKWFINFAKKNNNK